MGTLAQNEGKIPNLFGSRRIEDKPIVTASEAKQLYDYKQGEAKREDDRRFPDILHLIRKSALKGEAFMTPTQKMSEYLCNKLRADPYNFRVVEQNDFQGEPVQQIQWVFDDEEAVDEEK